jgi:uncharacterized damage-inducible protein DinB
MENETDKTGVDASQKILKDELSEYLKQGHAHKSLAEASKGLPMKVVNSLVAGVPYSPWALLEHIRITQRDILDFIKNPTHEKIEWPKDYWPQPDVKADRDMWIKTLESYEEDLGALIAIAKDPSVDLFAQIPHGTGQMVFRELLQVIDHASYHIGELVLMRRMLGVWEKEEK